MNKECPYVAKCGGCVYIGKPYEETLKIKQAEVERLLKRYGKVNTIVGADNPYNYRNKVHAVIASARKGEIVSGTYEAGTHRVVDVTSCAIDNEKSDAIIRTIVKLMKSFKYQPYNEDTHRGFLRHILVRNAHSTGQILVCLVIAEEMFPSKNNFVKALLKEHPEITTIVTNINNRNTSMILDKRENILYGPGYVVDELCGHRFRISAKSFYQINSEQTERLYRIAIDYAGFDGTQNVLDAYSGIGTIGITAAEHSRSVVGVELNRDAVKDAQNNVKLAGIKNATFECADAGEFMVRQAERGIHYDVVFMDPPRSGSTKEFMDSIAKATPKTVVYVSCNPKTLERDLKYLYTKGYKMKECTPVDMFPWTDGIEAVALLQKRM